MFLLIIILSYLLGCVSTIALLLYLYTRYAVNIPVVINEHQEEQFSTFHPLPENERAKNSAVDAVNYLLQFLFQELKDSSRLRRYIMHKLNTEFKELKTSRTGRIFLQNIVIQNFSIGNECPVFSDIQLERQERDERQLIKEFAARLDADYKDGFSVTLDITLLFGHKCLLYIKVKRIHGNLRLELRREPFCHWLLVFQDEPLIDFEVKSSFATVESPQLAQIITQQLRRAIKRKQTWPSYKIRYQPFFPTSKQSLPTEILTASGKNVVPGTFDILIKYCDRLSIPLAIFDKQKLASELVFLTINVHHETCADYLRIKREKWLTKEIDFVRNVTKMTIKEVNYMDRTELLIEEFEPIPNGIDDIQAFKNALAEKNLFLLKIRDEDVKTSKQTQRLLKAKSNLTVQDTASSSSSISTLAGEDKIPIVIGMPLLHSVRVEPIKEFEAEKQVPCSPALPVRNDSNAITSPTLRHRNNKQIVEDDEQTLVPPTTETVTPTKPAENQINKKPKPQKNAVNDIVLIMMNTDLLSQFHDKPTPPQKPDAYIEFNHELDFKVTDEERYLNVCLWCKAPLECGAPNAGQKLILLGYATIALSEIVLDAHMSYKRETQMTLNFRSPYSPRSNLSAYLTENESKKRIELSTHKGYDDDLAHGFVTINVKHRPEIEAKLNIQEKKEQFVKNSPILNEISTKLKEDEQKQDQLKYINTINEQQETPLRKPTDHIFEDKTFTTATVCSNCNKKIWMKSGRQCRDCLQTIHRKCEDKFTSETTCPHEPLQAKLIHILTPSDDDLKSIVNIELNTNNNNTPIITTTDEIEANLLKSNESTPNLLVNSNFQRSTTANRLQTKAAAAFSVLDSTARRSFRAFGNKNTHSPAPTISTASSSANLSPNLSTGSELSKSDESLHNATVTSTKKPTTNTPSPSQTSSKLANAASSAYSKLREFKSKRLPASTTDNETVRKSRLPSESTLNETILETDLRDIITKCLSDENNDSAGLEHLLHERAVDDTTLYAKAREVGPQLFPELTPDERKHKLDSEIARLQQEIDLQCQIRDEITHDCENPTTDENEKAKLKAKIANISDKIQALGALTILYCSGLKHCRTQMDINKSSLNNQTIPENDDPQENVPTFSLEHS